MRIAGVSVGDRWWNRSALAGLLGGFAMAVYQMVASALTGHGLWWPFNLIGGAIPYFRPLAPDVGSQGFMVPAAGGGLGLANPGMFWPGTTVGLALHLMTSMAWGLLYGLLVALLGAAVVTGVARSWVFALLVGFGWGFVSWLVMGLIAGPYLSPSLNYASPGQYFVGHIIFGIVTALSLTALTRQPRVSITMSPVATASKDSVSRR
jgi:hypothetical protein